MSSSGHAAKRSRLQELVACGLNASQAFAALQTVRAEPLLLEDDITEKALQRAAAAAFIPLEDHVTLPLERGREFRWDLVSLPNCIREFAAESENFKGLMKSLCARRRSTFDVPYKMVLFFDEACPGAVLHLDNRRKVWAFYISFIDFGPSVLQHEAAWIPIAVLRSDVAKKIQGGFSACAAALIKRLFVHDESIRKAGCVIPNLCGESPGIVFGQLGTLLCDEAALKAFWSIKGASGLLCCLVCSNICSLAATEEQALIAFDDAGTLRDIRCRPSDFVRRSDNEVFQQADAIHALHATLTRAHFETLERASGLTYNPDGALWDLDLRAVLRPVTMSMYDPTHTFFANGIALKELEQLLAKLRDVGVTFDVLEGYFSAAWDAAVRAPRMATHFNSARASHFRRTGTFAAQASDVLDIVPAMRHFLLTIPGLRARMELETRSFVALADLVACLKRCKCGDVNAAELRALLVSHAERHDEAYGPVANAHVPKWHFQFHMPEQCERDGFLCDTFATERRNYMIKQACDPLRNTTVFEKSAITRAILLHKRSLAHLRADGLVDPVATLETGRVSLGMRWLGCKVKEGCLLFCDERLYEFRGGFEHVNGSFYALGHACDWLEAVTPAAARYRKRGELSEVLLARDPRRFKFPALWSKETSEVFLVLRR